MASRFTVVAAPVLQPAYDYISGNAVGPFIDTGKDILGPGGRIMGRLHLSKDTVEEMARELGLLGEKVSDQALLMAYNRGKIDGLKEDLSGDIRNISATLGRWFASVDAGSPAEEVGSSS